MALSTYSSPVCAGGILEIEFPEETVLVQEHNYFVIYEGTNHRHVTTARLENPNKLCSTIPDHNEAENVQLIVFSFPCAEKTAITSCSCAEKTVVTSCSFSYYYDGVYHLAKFLMNSVYYQHALDDLEIIQSDNFNLADEELSTLDARLSRALSNLTFPESWSLLGTESHPEEHLEPRETLLHFAARLDLNRVASFFLRKPGIEQALKLPNQNGDLPKDIAIANGFIGLAELFSDYNVQRLLLVDRLCETNNKRVVQEAEDITLTLNLETHHTTVEEDIIVLQGLQKQLKTSDGNIMRQWQTDWPAVIPTYTDNHQEVNYNANQHFQAICEKVQGLPKLVSIEAIELHNKDTDHKLFDSYKDSNQVQEDAKLSVDSESQSLSQLYASEEEISGIMERSLKSLRNYNDQLLLLKIRDKSTLFRRILEQDFRKGSLARFSTSCPSLDISKLPPHSIDEADLCKSMVDLANDNVPDSTTSPTSHFSGDIYSSGADNEDSTDSIHVVVDSAITGSSSIEFGLQTQEYGQFLNEYYGANNAQVRRQGLSPQPIKQYSEEESQYKSPTMLIHTSQSVGCMPTEDEGADYESFHSHNDMAAYSRNDMADNSCSHVDRHSNNKTNLSAINSEDMNNYFQKIHSSGDLESQSKNNDVSRPPESQKSNIVKSGRGQLNKARYSADVEQLMKQAKERHSGSSLDKMAVSTHSTGSSTEDDSNVLGLPPHGKITKALSMSSIPAAANDKHKGYKDSRHAQFHRQDGIEEEGHQLGSFPLASCVSKQKTEVSLFDFLNETSNNFPNEGSTVPSPKQRDKEKDDKKHKNLFSRFQSSYRKKKDKEGKTKASSTHRFVSVSFSNAATCDVCRKPLTNKPAVRCQICLVNLHEVSCKEQISACDKFKSKNQLSRQSSTENETVQSGQERHNMQMGVSNLRPTYSFKANGSSRPQATYSSSSTQPVPINSTTVMKPDGQQQPPASAQMPRKSLPTPSSFSSPNTGTYLQWRRASSSSLVSVDRAIAEEVEADRVSRLDLEQPARLDPAHSNITDSISHSTESLYEVDGTNALLFDDVELGDLDTEEPETWSETVDKKVLKKINPKDVKRQDTIWELIQTERHYCKRLKTLQLVFRNGMQEDLKMSNAFVERMFPHLDDLMMVHMDFLRQLQDLQNKRSDKSVDEIGPTLYDHFSGDSANTMKESYGAFCSRHLESVQCYKDLMARDKSFQEFIKKRTYLPLCKKLEIPGFILLVTQRPTKYPTLIEAVIKSTKDKKDRESLLKALDKSKEVLQSINEQVAASERAARLRDIIIRMDSKSFAMYREKKFKKSDIASDKRVLLHDGVINWRNARGKLVEVLAVVLTDVLFFLQENNQKYSFFSQDNKQCVVSLSDLLVREKCDTKDTKGIYIISQNRKYPEMYEVVFNSTADMQKWATILRSAVENCPVEAEQDTQVVEAEAERCKIEKETKVKSITEKLNQKDEEFWQLCEEKRKLLAEFESIFNNTEDHLHSRPTSGDLDEALGGSENADLFLAICKAQTQLAAILPASNLSRSVSSVGEHLSRNFTTVPLPRRAETFAGFDTQEKVKLKGVDTTDFTSESPQEILCKECDTIDLDIGHPTDLKTDDSESESGTGSSTNVSAASANLLSGSTPLAAGTVQTQMNISSLVQTLNCILYLAAKQGTEVMTLRAQLAEANEKLNKSPADVNDKKTSIRHNQLEELRNLQGVIQKEKEEWELKKSREKSYMEQEHQELDELRRSLDKQEIDLKQQKEELSKNREVLQRQMELLRQSGQFPKETSLSDQEENDTGVDNVPSNDDFMPGHRRSSSADSFKSNKGDNKSNKGEDKPVATAPKENNFRPEQKSVTKLQSFSIGSSKQPLPVHLLSATNEQKVGSRNVQQIPSKLLTGGTISTSLQQMSQLPGSSTSHGNMSLGGGHVNQSLPSLSADVLSQGDRGHLGHSSSTSNMGTNQGQFIGSSVPKGQSNRPKYHVAGISGGAKVVEKGDMKAMKSSGSSQVTRDKGVQLSHSESVQSSQYPKSGTPTNKNLDINNKSQKAESDVIYL